MAKAIMQPRHKRAGFTLIELVVVIIILGILAVTAAPKFLNLQKDARVAALEGARASFDTARKLVYTKALLQGQQAVDSAVVNIDTDGDGVNDLAGYFGLIKFVIAAREYAGLDGDITLSKHYGGSATGLPYFLIYFADTPASLANQCFVEVYYPAAAGGQVSYNLVDDDC
ncbi:type II secretion system protein [Shewanella khirikhana]|nr:type II secretion system protein [Shewanella khirikhana]